MMTSLPPRRATRVADTVGFDAAIAQARAVPLSNVVAHLKLRRVGAELVGACPVHGGTDGFCIHVTRGKWICRGADGGNDAIGLVMHVYDFDFRAAVEMLTGARLAQDWRCAGLRQAPPAATKPTDDDAYARDQARKAAWLWAQRQPLAGSIGETYLREARGYGGTLPATLGFLPPRGDHGPAMIAAFALAPEIEPGILGEPVDVTAVHLTKLAADGRGKADVKPNKIIIGSPVGRPIVLAPVNDLLGLAITEGIEDAVSVSWATGLGTWAAGSAVFMPALVDAVPNYVECVTIFGHADPAGQRAARGLADRLVARDVEVFLEGL